MSYNNQTLWVYTQRTNPTDPIVGTAYRVDADVTLLSGGAFGPAFQTGFFGPRAVFQFEGLVRYGQDMSIIGLGPVGYGDFISVANTAGAARTLSGSWGFLSARSFIADGATVTLVGTDVNQGGAAFVDSAVHGTVDGGTLNGTTNNFEIVSYLSMPGLFGNTSVQRRVGYDARGLYEGIHPIIPEPTGPHWSGAGNFDPTSVSLVEEIAYRVRDFSFGAWPKIGLDMPAFGGSATVKVGVRNGNAYVGTPSVATITGAGSTITPDAEVKRLDNTSGGAVTLTSTPTIADGQDGQVLELCNASAQTVTLTHGTANNLRLDAGTNKTLATRASIRLRFYSSIGDWVQVTPVVTPT